MTAARYTPNIRIKSEDRSLIDWAAKAQCKTRTNVILEAARRAAENELLDHTVAQVSEDAYANFLARLDASPCSQRMIEAHHADQGPWE
ncbi:type II toxin-antitoxin system TacA family antitoxin [Xanthobacter variabilis]|uniref:type II toxin-antitoxin system TacA family antitoxin n=1 Tax=Xanthobacter variabilis TaxID=3119932 RepID=UPI00374E61DE